MSLRDQLLKAGVASKKQARKAENAIKKEKKKKRKKDGPTESEQISEQLADQRKKSKERDKELNRQIEDNRREREKIFQAKEIIVSRDRRDPYGKIKYYFSLKSNQIKSIDISQSQLSLLTKGKMGIAVCTDKADEEDLFFLLEAQDCSRIKGMLPQLIVCHHDSPLTTEEEKQYKEEEDLASSAESFETRNWSFRA